MKYPGLIAPLLECSYRESGLGKLLSNLYPREFEFMNQQFASMEGFLQSLKTADSVRVSLLSSLSGIQAWKQGQLHNDWKVEQKLYFGDTIYLRESPEYYFLILSAYRAQFDQNPEFATALNQSFPQILTHVGKMDPKDSVLTVYEYIWNLERLRALTLQ